MWIFCIVLFECASVPRLGLSHWDPYAVLRGGCLELYYGNMVEWFWWDSSLISTTNWFPSVLCHCLLGHLACKNRPRNDLLCVEWDIKLYTLTHLLSYLCSLLYLYYVVFVPLSRADGSVIFFGCLSICLAVCERSLSDAMSNLVYVLQWNLLQTFIVWEGRTEFSRSKVKAQGH